MSRVAVDPDPADKHQGGRDNSQCIQRLAERSKVRAKKRPLRVKGVDDHHSRLRVAGTFWWLSANDLHAAIAKELRIRLDPAVAVLLGPADDAFVVGIDRPLTGVARQVRNPNRLSHNLGAAFVREFVFPRINPRRAVQSCEAVARLAASTLVYPVRVPVKSAIQSKFYAWTYRGPRNYSCRMMFDAHFAGIDIERAKIQSIKGKEIEQRNHFRR